VLDANLTAEGSAIRLGSVVVSVAEGAMLWELIGIEVGNSRQYKGEDLLQIIYFNETVLQARSHIFCKMSIRLTSDPSFNP
jgi:hypothetical protein